MSVGTTVDQIGNLGAPNDYNGDQLQIGDDVLVAIRQGELAEARVSELHVCAVTVTSKRDPSRRLTVNPAGCIKFAE